MYFCINRTQEIQWDISTSAEYIGLGPGTESTYLQQQDTLQKEMQMEMLEPEPGEITEPGNKGQLHSQRAQCPFIVYYASQAAHT